MKKSLILKFSFVFLLMIPVFTAIFYAVKLAVSYDEAWTFLNFTTKDWSAALCHYPAPNNHILNSVLTKVFYRLPIASNLLKLRLPSLLVHGLFIIAGYKFISRHYNAKTAILVTAVSATTFMALYYGYMARGYGLVNLCFVITLWSSFNIINGKNDLRNWSIFGLFSCIGFYAIPTFLYAFATLNFFILLFLKKDIKKQLITNAAVMLAVFLLYLPIIIHDGLESLTGNSFIEPIGLWNTIRTLPRFFIDIIGETTGIHWAIMLFPIACSGYYIVKSNKKPLLLLALSLVVVPAVLMAAQRVIPFHRVFNYYGFAVVLLIIVPFSTQIGKIRYRYLLSGIFLLQLLLVWNFGRKIYQYEDKDLALNTTAGKIIPEIIGNKRYLFRNTLLPANLEFELIENGYRNYHLEYFFGNNADKVNGFDYVIIEKGADSTKTAKPIIQTPYYNIYKK